MRELCTAFVGIYSLLQLLLLPLQCTADIGTNLQMQLGNPSNAARDTNNHTHYLIQRSVEAIDYNDSLGQPNWASWDLTASDVGTNARSDFVTDTTLPPNFLSVTPAVYENSDFARGHMCPSKDRTDTGVDNELVFLMSNVVPQNSLNNSGVWLQFENYCRALAQTNELLIICGPSGFPGARIDATGPAIPDYVWKIAVVLPTGTGTALERLTTSTRVIALKIPNTDSATNAWPTYRTSARQIEVDTGLAFFNAVPTNVADVLRNKVDGATNPVPVVFDFSPRIGLPSDHVIITGTHFESASAVTFDGRNAAFTQDSETQITAVVPANTSSGVLSVTTASGTSVSSNKLTVIGGGVYAGTIAGWDVRGVGGGLHNYGASPLPPTTLVPNVSVVGLTRGFGVGTTNTAAANAWGGTGFTSTNGDEAIAAGKFATWGVSANPGYKVSFKSISRFDYRHSPTGPGNGLLQFQIGSAFFTITNFMYPPVGSSGQGSIPAIDLSGFVALQNIGAGTNVTFRIVNYGGTNPLGTWYVFDKSGDSSPDLALDGVVTPTRPTLSLHVMNGSLALAWPTSFVDYVLQQNGDLGSTNWTTCVGVAATNDATRTVTVPLPVRPDFYRLFHP